MKTIRRIVCAATVAAALFLTPTQTKANGLGNLLHAIFGGGRNDRNSQRSTSPPTTTNYSGSSVPINGGLVVLLVAGLGLGIKILKDKTNRQPVNSIL